jgi:hypothetical protein
MVSGLYRDLDGFLVGDRAHHDAVDRDVPLLILRNADSTPRSNQSNRCVARNSLVCAVYAAVMLADLRTSGADATNSAPEAQQEIADEPSRHRDDNDDLDDVRARTTQDACHEWRVTHYRFLPCAVSVAQYLAG